MGPFPVLTVPKSGVDATNEGLNAQNQVVIVKKPRILGLLAKGSYLGFSKGEMRTALIAARHL
tara:strand:+ start:16408 stop:16596 length:189 start_codon:yes stop_codon:yes gene_type:complete